MADYGARLRCDHRVGRVVIVWKLPTLDVEGTRVIATTELFCKGDANLLLVTQGEVGHEAQVLLVVVSPVTGKQVVECSDNRGGGVGFGVGDEEAADELGLVNVGTGVAMELASQSFAQVVVGEVAEVIGADHRHDAGAFRLVERWAFVVVH